MGAGCCCSATSNGLDAVEASQQLHCESPILGVRGLKMPPRPLTPISHAVWTICILQSVSGTPAFALPAWWRVVGFVDEGAVDISTVFSFTSLPFVAKLGLFEHWASRVESDRGWCSGSSVFATAPGCECVKESVVVPSSCPAEQPLDSGKSICATIPSPETLPALAPWCLLRCLRLPPPLFRGDTKQTAVPCTGAVEIQGVCDISGYQDLYRVSAFGWQWWGFGRLCVESPVHLFIQKAVKVEWVKNVPAQQEIGWQDGLALRVGTPSSFTITRVFKSSTHRAAALIDFLLLRFGLLGAILSFCRRFDPNNPTFTLSIVIWCSGFLSVFQWCLTSCLITGLFAEVYNCGVPGRMGSAGIVSSKFWVLLGSGVCLPLTR